MSEIKPIQSLEQLLNITFKLVKLEVIMNVSSRCSYALNDNQEVIGLNLHNCKLNTLSFIKPFKQLIKLNLSSNQITSISALKTCSLLQALNLQKNAITDIHPLKNLLQLQELNLQANDIVDIRVFEKIINLTTLNLSSNKISDLIFLSKLFALQKLNLSDNKLINLIGIDKLTNINELDLRFNQLISLQEINSLLKLSTLFINNNKVTDITALNHLTCLENFHASFNEIYNLSPINNLINLKILDLRVNKVQDIKALKLLNNLTHLYLESNSINNIQALEKSKKLVQLNLRNNQITDINALIGCKYLTHLYLSKNKIQDLPKWLLELNLPIKLNNGGEGISVIENPLKSPPIDIIQRGNLVIEDYYKQLTQQKKSSIKHLKIHIIGDQGVGKTSFIKALIGEQFNSKEVNTNGISIHHWQHEDIKLNCWDFSGKHTLQTLNQTFFLPRSVYLLVLDQNSQAIQWLIRIENINPKLPIFIILNKSDSLKQHTLDYKFLNNRFPNIIGYYSVSCLQKTGIEDFKLALYKVLKKIPSVNLQVSADEILLKSALEKKLFINYLDGISLCNEHGITDSKAQLQFINLLIYFGDIVYISPANKQKEHAIICNPTWITKSLSKLFNNSATEQNGKISLNEIKNILSDNAIEDINCIIKIMLQLSLAYQINDDNFLIPSLLQNSTNEIPFDDSNALKIEIQFNYLTPLIMSRLIIALYTEIMPAFCYANQIKLENSEFNSCAIITANYAANLISIKTLGEKNRAYFTYLRDMLYQINP